jgi:hypothetical protein
MHSAGDLDVLCSDKYLSLAGGGKITYVKTDYLHVGPVMWRGALHNPGELSGIVLCGHSDHPLTDDIVDRHPRVSAWFAINNLTTRGNVCTLPLGITNDTDESPMHRIYGNTDSMQETLAQRQVFTEGKLAYLNISVSTYPAERAEVVQRYAECAWVTHEAHAPTETGRKHFLQQLRAHKFCFAPRGNGLDTHRLWESLYMGCIPIVKYHTAYADFHDLPILFVSNWEDVTETLLNRTFDEFATRKWNTDKLYFPYWKKRIGATGLKW